MSYSTCASPATVHLESLLIRVGQSASARFPTVVLNAPHSPVRALACCCYCIARKNRYYFAHTAKAVQLPSQADKSRRSVGPAAKPPWAASNCTRASRRLQFAPATPVLVAAAAAPLTGAAVGGGFCSLE
jgi:hypothetical protein